MGDKPCVFHNNHRTRDRARGREYTLTLSQVRELFRGPCEYCLKPAAGSIDRKDSSIGHVPSNCVPCCRRCNTIKNSMPFAAWEMLVPVVRQAAASGAFEDWLT